jgi:hypothetical protein
MCLGVLFMVFTAEAPKYEWCHYQGECSWLVKDLVDCERAGDALS